MKPNPSFLKTIALGTLFVVRGAGALIYEGDLVSANVTPPRMETTLSTKLYAVSIEAQWVNEEVFSCEDTPTSQAAGDWDGFFEEPEPENKALLLAGKIKGLGFGIALRLVEDRALTSKPASWREFERSIAYADRRYQTGFSHRVLIIYKRENIQKLGYRTADCPSHEEQIRRSVQTRDNVHGVSRKFTVDVQTVPLRPGETERLTLLYDGLVDRIDARSEYNKYVQDRQQNGETVTYRVTGTRRAIPPRNTVALSAVSRNGRLYFDVSDAGYEERLDGDAARSIVGTVEATKTGWHSAKTLVTFELVLPYTRAGQLDPNVTIPSGRTLAIRWSVRYRNSRYFTDEVSPVKNVTFR